MHAMAENTVQILVSSSVIVVGIDIPNATIMLIEGAERFGLAQLHQFRGRVGRSDHQSYCFLLPSTSEKEDIARLQIMVSCADGFALAEKDLELRGPGDFLGTRQSGILSAYMQSSLADVSKIKKARDWAEDIMEHISDYPEIKIRLEQFEREVHLE